MNERSNISFVNNIYVIEGESKLSDKNFMKQVVDPGAVREIAKLLPKDANGRVRFAYKLHGEIFENSIPCRYGNGDYTHGVIREGEELVFVNTCENESCGLFKNCSSAFDYRKIVRAERITSENVPNEVEPDDDFCFDIDLPVTPRIARAQKLHLSKIRKREFIEEIKTGVHTIEYKRWGVRGFWRRLPDGTKTWVRPHNRHHDEEEQIVRYFVKRFKYIKYKFKDCIQLEKFRNFLTERNRIISQQKSPEEFIAQNNTYQLQNIKQIDSAENIIKSSIFSRILVNAGPGTGKTHTVIERLKYIDNFIQENDEEGITHDSILVLCFSRSAVKVIRDRLAEAINKGDISPYTKRFTIMTFDSFATWYLMQIEPKRNLIYNSYDERIKIFINEYERDVTKLNEGLSYLIVDEVQDLVGARAELVQSLLNNINCGFLLLGDECQAIYDYQITDEKDMNAAKLYKWLENSFDTLEEYELMRDWRHTALLSEMLAPLRRSMLYRPFNIQKEELTKIIKNYDVSDLSAEDIVKCCNGEGRRAILSWSNGDAYRQSQNFYLSDIGVKHTVLTGSRKLRFRKEISIALSNYTNNTIDHRTFMKLVAESNIDRELAQKIWSGILFTTDKDNDDYIPVEALRRAMISERRVDEALISEDDADVVISTIHKAKGCEFDTVLLNQIGDVDSSDSIKVYYVALTRAKNELVVRRGSRYGNRDLQVDRGRYIEVNRGNLKRIELGIDGDIDPIGFVSKSLNDMDVQARQLYIRDNVKIGDAIKISKFHEEYLIVHNGHFIGRLNKDILNTGYAWNRRYNKFNKYTDFVELFVNDVVTIVNKTLNPDIAEPYDKSGFWLGIEFCGYARPLEE